MPQSSELWSKGNGQTTCRFEYGGALTEAVLLGNVSYRAHTAIHGPGSRHEK